LTAVASKAETATDPRKGDENPARELLASLYRGKWVVLCVFLLVSGLVYWGTLRQLPVFEAESSLIVRIGREYVYRPDVGRGETGTRTPSLAEMVNSEVEILSSRDLAEMVVRAIGVEKLFPEILELEPDPGIAVEKAVLKFRAAASIRPVLESSVIKVGFEHSVPALAAEAVNLLVERFKDKHIEVFGEERATRIETQLLERTELLQLASRSLADFKHTNDVYDIAEQRRLLLDRRERLDQSLQAAEVELAVLRLKAGPEGQEEPPDLPALPPHLRPEMKDELLRQRYELELALRGFEPPASDRLVEQASLRLLDLELEERELLRDYSPTNRKVLSVQQEIVRVRSFLEKAETRAGDFDQDRRAEREARGEEIQDEINRLTSEIELLVREEERLLRLDARRGIQALEIQRADLAKRLTAVELEVRVLDQQEQPLRGLERELAAAETAYQVYKDRLEEARVTEELDREKQISVKVIEKASAPVEPTGLPPKLQIAIGAFVGLIAGAGLAVLMDLFRAR
jgi:uncharacterized protein involved in exopolysaccharide biosynthesis